MYLYQGEERKLLQDKKTIDWLIHNTEVSEFDPIKFTGYQRQVDQNHIKRIVKYLEEDFTLPTSIICATDQEYDENTRLRIVDGQHRIQAFRELKEINNERYQNIKNYEISIVVMETPSEMDEIDTFITINKTSKKVDTSLAYVLKNKINNNLSSDELSISKRDYIAVELAQKMDSSSELWKDKISFEGPIRNTNKFISLNAFVKSTRSLLYALEIKKIINLEWENKNDIDIQLNDIYDLFEYIWQIIHSKWPQLFTGHDSDRTIIQGAIGYSSINRFLAYNIKKIEEGMSISNIKKNIRDWINDIDIRSNDWEPGNRFSNYTSESGYSIVARELQNSLF